MSLAKTCDEEMLLDLVCGQRDEFPPTIHHNGEGLNFPTLESSVKHSKDQYRNFPNLTPAQLKRFETSQKDVRAAYRSLLPHVSEAARTQIEEHLAVAIKPMEVSYERLRERPGMAVHSYYHPAGEQAEKHVQIGAAYLVYDQLSNAVLDLVISHELGHALNPLSRRMRMLTLEKHGRDRSWDPRIDSCFEKNISTPEATDEMFSDWLASHVIAFKATQLPKMIGANYVVSALRLFCNQRPSEEKFLSERKAQIAKNSPPEDQFRVHSWRAYVPFASNYLSDHVPEYERLLLMLRHPGLHRALGCDKIVSVANKAPLPHCHIGDGKSGPTAKEPPEKQGSGTKTGI